MKTTLVRNAPDEKTLVVKEGDLVQYTGEGLFIALVLDNTSASFSTPAFRGIVLYSENSNRKVGSIESKFLNRAFEEFKGQLKLQN